MTPKKVPPVPKQETGDGSVGNPPAGITITFNLLNRADALKVVKMIVVEYEGPVADLLQELSLGIDAYLNEILQILGAQKFATNPGARIVAKRLAAFMPEPQEAAAMLKKELRWQKSVDDGVRILMDLIDGLAPTGPLKNFVEGLLIIFEDDPLVTNYRAVIQNLEGVQVRNLGANQALISILEKYVVGNGGKSREIAERTWAASETATSVDDVIKNLKSLFPESEFEEASLTDLADKLLKARENRQFWGFVAKVVTAVGFSEDMNFNGPFSVLINHARGELKLETWTDEDAQTVAARLRNYFQEMTTLTKSAIQQKLVADHKLSTREDKHKKGLDFLVAAITQTFGSAD